MRFLCIVFTLLAIPLGGALAGNGGGGGGGGGGGDGGGGGGGGGNTSGSSSTSVSGSKVTTVTNPTVSPSINMNYTSSGGGTSTIRNTPDAVPGTIYGGTNPCAVGASAAMSVAGLGIGGGGMWNSPGCERRNGAVILFQANLPDVAIALLCQDEEMRTAFRQAGRPCPADRVQVAAAPEPAPVSYAPPPTPVAPPPAPVQSYAPPPSAETAPVSGRQDWCATTRPPRPSDRSPDATSYRYYCQ